MVAASHPPTVLTEFDSSLSDHGGGYCYELAVWSDSLCTECTQQQCRYGIRSAAQRSPSHPTLLKIISPL